VLELEQRDTELAKLARTLLREMPKDVQTRFLRQHSWLADGPDPASRQAVVIAVVQLFMANDKAHTTPDVQGALERQGIHADAKRIHNTLLYLAADGRLKRVGRGLYQAGNKLKVSREEVTGEMKAPPVGSAALAPGWRNWETQRSWIPPSREGLAGSNPVPGILSSQVLVLVDKFRFHFNDLGTMAQKREPPHKRKPRESEPAEKPVSLAPLSFEDAIRGLTKVKTPKRRKD
jgi:hypothetical protein